MKKMFGIVVVLMSLVLSSSAFAGSYAGVMKGTLKGAYVTFKDNISADEVYIKSGYGECNGNYFEIPSDVTYELTSITGEDFYYIYIDDSDDSYPVLDSDGDFLHSTTEPSWNDSKQGWYNGNDRCIGVVWVDSSNDLAKFSVNYMSDTLIEVKYYSQIKLFLSSDDPTGSWETLTSSSDYVPINANASLLFLSDSDASSYATMSASSYEKQDMYEFILNCYQGGGITGWVQLEGSRDIAWRAASDDDLNSIYLRTLGYRYKR